MGNFWSDNNSTADGAVYKIANRNIDYHPLLSPLEFSALEMSSTEVPQELSGLTRSQETGSANFPTVLVLAIVLPVIAITAVAGLLVYFTKRPRVKCTRRFY